MERDRAKCSFWNTSILPTFQKEHFAIFLFIISHSNEKTKGSRSSATEMPRTSSDNRGKRAALIARPKAKDADNEAHRGAGGSYKQRRSPHPPIIDATPGAAIKTVCRFIAEDKFIRECASGVCVKPRVCMRGVRCCPGAPSDLHNCTAVPGYIYTLKNHYKYAEGGLICGSPLIYNNLLNKGSRPFTRDRVRAAGSTARSRSAAINKQLQRIPSSRLSSHLSAPFRRYYRRRLVVNSQKWFVEATT